MRALVTGATGFVGEHLVAHLCNGGYRVYGTYLDNQSRTMSAQVKLFQCDVRDPQRLCALMQRARPDRVYHLAAESSVTRSFADVQAVFETNFWGTFNLLEAVRLSRPHGRVLVVTSSHCYGAVPRSQLPVRESYPLSPRSPYALSKAAADMLAAYYHHRFGLHVIRARPFNHTGPGQAPEFVCSDLARQVAAIELSLQAPVLRVGNLDVERDFSDVRDVVRAYHLLLEKGKPGQAYNVSSGRPVRVRRIARLLQSFSSHPVRILVQRSRIRPGEVRTLYGSNRKLRRATGWKAEHTLRRTLSDLFIYWKNLLGTLPLRQARGVN